MDNKMKYLLQLVVVIGMVFFSGCKEHEWGEDYDINLPVSVITSISADAALVGDELTLTGTALDKVSNVWIGDKECTIVDGTQTATAFNVVVPRRAGTGSFRVKNLYRREFVYEEALKVSYPDVTVTKWPTKIVVGSAFEIQGNNVDLITVVEVNGQKINIPVAGTIDKLVVPTSGIVGLVPGETASIKLTALGEINQDNIAGVAIEEPTNIFNAAEAIVLWDFEDGEPDMVDLENSPAQAGINLGGVPKARGNNYFSVLNPNEDTGWKTYFYIRKQGPFDLSAFHEPNITFLINTNGKRGYVNPFMTQDGSAKDNHLHDGNANENLKYGDNYAVQTDGWEWRSYPISKLFGDFNPMGTFEEIALRFISGNVGNGDDLVEDFVVHIDQVMITDGPQNPVAKVLDFEDGADPWEDNGFGANHAIKSVAPFGSGNNYYSVWLTSGGKWNWTGAIANYSAVDLSATVDPHFSFIFNTNGNKGMVQVEVWQNDTKWGGSVDMSEYYIQSDGWVPLSIRLADYLGNWGGDASEFDPTAPIDYVKVGFTTGNVDSGEAYEMNIDDIYISDGPMW